LRIFVAVRHSLDPGQYFGSLWSGNFYPALRQLGHELIESQVDLLPASRFMQIARDFTPQELAVRGNLTQAIVDEVKKAHAERPVDLFLSYFYASHFDPAGFDDVDRLGIPVVNFFCNSLYQFELVAPIAARARWSWHAERDARPRYEAIGARPVWVQMAADPEVYRPIPDLPREPSACFVGQRYADRDRWARALVEARLPLALYGQGWLLEKSRAPSSTSAESEYLGRRIHRAGSLAGYWAAIRENLRGEGFLGGLRRTARQWRYRSESRALAPLLAPLARGLVPAGGLNRAFGSHEVVLNFSNVWADGRPGSDLIPHVRLRDFEAPMCRSCYLTGHTEEIAEFYVPGKEIETYRAPAELIDKVTYYLRKPDAAEALRQAGYERARRDHTWVRRFEELFHKLNLPARG
jgi:spore maturation protein CgeB